MASLYSAPNEIILLVCSVLEDKDLLAFCQVSRRLHFLALDTLFARHNICESGIQSGNLSVTSQSLRGLSLAIWVSSVKKLACVFDEDTAESDVLRLQRFVSRVQNVEEVNVITERREPLPLPGTIIRTDCLLGLLFALIPDKFSNLLILRGDGTFDVSKHRRHLRPLCFPWFEGRVIRSRSELIAYVFLILCMRAALRLRAFLTSVITDPSARSCQEGRIKEDLGMFPRRKLLAFHSARIKSINALPLTLITFNESLMTTLRIGEEPCLGDQWRHVLPYISLPALEQLHVERRVRLRYDVFIAFVHRHPSIVTLQLEYASLKHHPPTAIPSDCLPALRTLQAPLRHIIRLLRARGNARNLDTLSIISSHPLAKYGAKLISSMTGSEPPFDFDELDEVLALVADNDRSLALEVRVPGGSAAQHWLMKMDGSHPDNPKRVERRASNVTSVSFSTLAGKSLDPHLVSLVPKWLALFPNLRKVTIGLCVVPARRNHRKIRLLAEICNACPHIRELITIQ